MKKLAIGFVAAIALGACTSSGWEDWGGFTLASDELAVHHRVKQGQHRLELLHRVTNRQGRVLRWETLDSVDLQLAEGTLVCMSAARNGGTADYVAIAEDDPQHQHRVLRAWRVDEQARKLVSAPVDGVVCNPGAEPRTK
ncbi:MAG: hypothetical protein M3Q69_10365 [Acidobacteriota bacterium]|nr:hypothetical protein [Acidobacteriota bacterium]